MTNIAYLPPPLPRRRRRPQPKFNLRQFLFGFCIGYFGGAIALSAAFLIVNSLFPPPRLNVLIIGLDRRPGESTVARADTLILATVNPKTSYVGLLSIPRDLWVTLPDGSQNRINTAHFFAEAATPGTGPAATVETVSANFGVSVHKYIRIDFAGFVRIIDSVGGITINIQEPIIDDHFPTYDYGIQTISFEAGEQHLDGERALQYARTRHASSDFDRAKRQQAVIAAFTRRLLEPGAWLRFPSLFVTILSAVDTNLTPLEILRLLPTLISVGPEGMDRRVIEGDLVLPFTTSGGASVQLPIWDTINPVLLEMFGE